MSKKCTGCGLIKEISQYYTNGRLKSGATRYHSKCKPCHDADRREKRNNNLKIALEELGMRLECMLCGYNKNKAALCFHHLEEDEKDFGFSGANYPAVPILKAELAKCVVLCHNCHMEYHYPHMELPR